MELFSHSINTIQIQDDPESDEKCFMDGVTYDRGKPNVVKV